MSFTLAIKGGESFAEIQSVISDNTETLSEKLTRVILYYSEGAYVIPESFKIRSCEYAGDNLYTLFYEYQWAVTNGCLNLHSQSTVKESVNFLVRDNEIFFDTVEIFKPSTADEL